MIKAENLCVEYGARYAVVDVSLEVMPGQMLGIAGPNGAGKSSLMQALVGLIVPGSGRVEIDGVSNKNQRAFRRAAARLAYVPQKQHVATGFPITVRDVVGMGQYAQLGWLGRRSAAQVARIDQALEKLGLSGLANQQFSALSGGQQQKTLVARALSQAAEVLMLDEPFRGVDAKSQRAIVRVLKEHRAAGGSVVIVHHGAEILTELCDELLLINRVLVARGSPAQLLANPKHAAMLGGEAVDFAAESVPLAAQTSQRFHPMTIAG